MLLFTAFLLGLGSSLHCVGMCGAIALALPHGRTDKAAFFMGRLSYNLGRTTTYAALGLVSGLFGYTLSLSGGQQGLSVVLGLLLIASTVFSLRLTRLRRVEQALSTPARLLGKHLRPGARSSLFGIGLLNGFLPCGMVYVALAGATVTGNALQGALYMALFGLGTIPLMLATSLLGRYALPSLRKHVQPVSVALSLFFAAALIVRGLNLGIPFLSPEISRFVAICH